MDQRPKVGVGVIVRNKGKVVLLKRKNSHGKGCWSFSGGHLEFNETPEECAKREVMEEMGIKIRNVKIVGVTNDIFEEEGKHYITLFVLADYDSGQIVNKEPNKCESIDWFSWDNLPEPLFLPIKNLLKQGYSLP